jgi:DivIVA domain-containing protein
MALTPADVHNVAFSRPRIGKRGYNEQEVDLFIDLVEQELTRHLTEDTQIRKRNGVLQKREAELAARESELAEREARLVEREAVLRRQVRKHEGELRRQKGRLAELEAKLTERGTPLPQQLAQLRFREAQVARREAEIVERQAQLRRQNGKVRPRADQQQLTAAMPQPAAGNGASRGEVREMRTVAAVHGRHDVERMAIREITDMQGNTVTERVHERTRRSRVEHGGQSVATEPCTELEQLREENAALFHSLSLLKGATALLAAALDRS